MCIKTHKYAWAEICLSQFRKVCRMQVTQIGLFVSPIEVLMHRSILCWLWSGVPCTLVHLCFTKGMGSQLFVSIGWRLGYISPVSAAIKDPCTSHPARHWLTVIPKLTYPLMGLIQAFRYLTSCEWLHGQKSRHLVVPDGMEHIVPLVLLTRHLALFVNQGSLVATTIIQNCNHFPAFCHIFLQYRKGQSSCVIFANLRMEIKYPMAAITFLFAYRIPCA